MFLGLYLVVLQIADGVVTMIGLNSGWLSEGNRYVVWCAGEWWFGLVKALFVAGVVVMMYWLVKRGALSFKVACCCLGIWIVFYLFIVCRNVALVWW